MNQQTRQFHMPDGATLAANVWGDENNPAVILSHGGGQTRHAWQGTGIQLAERGFYAVAYDHRGHGQSSWTTAEKYQMTDFANDQACLAGQVRANHRCKPVLVGASLGGLSALMAEDLNHNTLYRAIVLVDIVPRMNQQGAMKILEFMESNLREGFDTLEQVAETIAVYTGRTKPINPQGLKKNLRLCDDGKYRWHWDPKFLTLRHDRSGSADRLNKVAQSLTYPMMLVRGRESDVVTESVAQSFLQSVPHCEYVDIQDAAHMVAGDKNDVFSQEIYRFLTQLPDCR